MNQEAPKPLPFPSGWWSFGLEGYRECDSTYCLYAYESLPPIDDAQLTGTLDWLVPLDEEVAEEMEVYHAADEEEGRLQLNVGKAAAQAQQLGLPLPPAFLRLLGSRELQNRIPSCTACYFSLAEEILPYPGKDGYFLRFLNDQQGVLLWYLYLTPQGDECVLASPYWLDELDNPDWYEDLTEGDRQAMLASTVVCAPSFEAFIYRFWLENTLYFDLDRGAPLTEAQQRYLRSIKQNMVK